MENLGCARKVALGLLVLRWLLPLLWTWGTAPVAMAGEEPFGSLSPSALALTADGRTLCVACATGNKVLFLDAGGKGDRVWELDVPATPIGMALTRDSSRLLVTCAGAVSRLVLVDLGSRKIVANWAAGHTANSPVVGADGKTLYVCYRYDNAVGVHSLVEGRELYRVPCGRQPVSVAELPGGKVLLVAHHLPDGGEDTGTVAATLGVIDLERKAMTKQLALPPGATLLRDVRVSPGGEVACVVHDLARYQLPTTQLERGWMNTSALTIVDCATVTVRATVLLDELDRGAANPWGVDWSPDGRQLWVTHAGTHEVSRVDWPGLQARLDAVLHRKGEGTPEYVTKNPVEIANDLSFLLGLRTRIALGGRGPRAVCAGTNQVFVASYFSESLDVIGSPSEKPVVRALSLHTGPVGEPSIERRGEEYFNDASLCFQEWQSCASCHGEDARVDGLNWDLLNDGIGNPKNSKSLLLSHRTPPAMSMGVRVSAEVAVRAGIQHILFAAPREEIAAPIDAWLKSLEPLPSPALVNGALSPGGKRGEKLFLDTEVGCARCHPGPLYTNLERYDVGTSGPFDKPGELFDTPTLVEVWRTAPYLHDGSARTLKDVLTNHNKRDAHGVTSTLSPGELEDLITYVLSL